MKRTLARRYGKGKAKVRLLLFPRSDWALQDAITWAALHGFKTSDVDTTQNNVRVHQSRKTGGQVRTIPYGTNGMRAVVEYQ